MLAALWPESLLVSRLSPKAELEAVKAGGEVPPSENDETPVGDTHTTLLRENSHLKVGILCRGVLLTDQANFFLSVSVCLSVCLSCLSVLSA